MLMSIFDTSVEPLQISTEDIISGLINNYGESGADQIKYKEARQLIDRILYGNFLGVSIIETFFNNYAFYFSFLDCQTRGSIL